MLGHPSDNPNPNLEVRRASQVLVEAVPMRVKEQVETAHMALQERRLGLDK